MNRSMTLFLIASLVACKQPEPQPRPNDAAEYKGPIDDAPLFDADHLVEVAIELDPADWSAVRGQSRDLFDVLLGDCLAQPFTSPYAYREASISIDGEVVQGVGLRKKGMFGSLSTDKPSLKIKTDWFVEDELLDNGTERLTLNNNVQDPSMVNQCIGYSVFAAAGLPAPRCNFAVVMVNDEPLGVYSHVEAVKKDFLKRHFADEDGDLYEGTMSDFHPDWTGTFTPKTSDTDPGNEAVLEIMAALDAPDDRLLASLGEVLDLPAFYKFWAIEALIGHQDGYAFNQNNYAIYRDPSTELVTFIPWGADTLFLDAPQTQPVFLTAWLTQRIWSVQEGREAYVAAMEDVLDTAWDEPHLLAEVQRMEELIGPFVHDPVAMTEGLSVVRAFIEARRGVVEGQLAGLAANPFDESMRQPICFEDYGAINLDFDTTYGSLLHDPFLYSGTLSGDTLPAGLTVGSTAGTDGYGSLIVSTLGVVPGASEQYEVVATLPTGLTAGTHWLDFGQTQVEHDAQYLGIVIGSVTLTEVGENPGDRIVGSIEGTILGL